MNVSKKILIKENHYLLSVVWQSQGFPEVTIASVLLVPVLPAWQQSVVNGQLHNNTTFKLSAPFFKKLYCPLLSVFSLFVWPWLPMLAETRMNETVMSHANHLLCLADQSLLCERVTNWFTRRLWHFPEKLPPTPHEHLWCYSKCKLSSVGHRLSSYILISEHSYKYGDFSYTAQSYKCHPKIPESWF